VQSVAEWSPYLYFCFIKYCRCREILEEVFAVPGSERYETVRIEASAVSGSESYGIVPIEVSAVSFLESHGMVLTEVFAVSGAESYETALKRPLLVQVRRAME
jgi:hypothetical protein